MKMLYLLQRSEENGHTPFRTSGQMAWIPNFVNTITRERSDGTFRLVQYVGLLKILDKFEY